MKKTTTWKIISAVLAVALIAVSCTWAFTANNTSGKPETTSASDTADKSADALSLWTKDAKLKTELTDYMKAITNKSSKDFIPVENRIAVFDMDGTLCCETDPGYFDHKLLYHRVMEDPDYKNKASKEEKAVAKKISDDIQNSNLTAKQVKELVKIPVITVSRVNDPFLADEILASGKADIIAMGRASLCDPEMPNKAKAGRFEDIRRCIGCNDGCIGVLFGDEPITCVLNPELGHEYEGGIPETSAPKKVAVAGAGPAGLYAAIAAARAGHKVTVFEKTDHNGGNFYTAAIPPTKGEITDFLVWQRVQCGKLGVEIRYNTAATAALIKEGGFDKVIVATGSHPAVPPIPGIKDSPIVTNAQEVLEGRIFPGAKCVVIGGGQVGAETAHFLTQMLRKVNILEMLPEIA